MDLIDPQFQEYVVGNYPKIPLRKWFKSEPYTIDELELLKAQLNAAKSTLDCTTKLKRYNKLKTEMYYAESLRSNHGILVNEYGAQIVTKAWLKIYELVYQYVPIGRDFYSFHVAEAPGAFLPSINHLIRTKYPDTNWDWVAESYATGGKIYLGDHHGLITKYSSKWLLGADGDGDITSSANIRWFRHYIKEHFSKLHLYTSDVKFVPPGASYALEELYQIPVHVGHTICALKTLSKGGVAILKTFTYFEPQSVSLLYLLSQCFEQVILTKPISSSPANSETYLVCTGFLDNVTPSQTSCLYKYLDACQENPTTTTPLFAKDDMPAEFINQLVEAQKALMARQISYITRQVNIFKTYRDPRKLSKNVEALRDKIARNWLNAYELEPIDAALLL